jgi:hypothetical protein
MVFQVDRKGLYVCRGHGLGDQPFPTFAAWCSELQQYVDGVHIEKWKFSEVRKKKIKNK